jgi:1,2-diacylglycerol 3-beta-glucosyltransferase
MPKNSWTDNNPDKDMDPISSILSEWSDPEEEEEEFRSDFFQGLEGRRRKAAFVLMMVWGVTIMLHLVTWGTWVIMAITGLFVFQGLRMVTAKQEPHPPALSDVAVVNAPPVSLLVAAKNEEAVISHLVEMLCDLDYPTDKYEVWVIDDYSTDKTPQILDQLALEYPQLRVIHRPAGAGGGKSGALNQVLPLTKGEIIGVFDADAKVSPNLLRRLIPLFDTPEMGAVQVRKEIANSGINFWTKGQSVEMALDSYYQQQRIAIGGVGELRGNGQFVRRSALQSCGGWNEQTITDDLDLTIRLHLDNWKIGFLFEPVVDEEGVSKAISLWHQRNRWAEGGYQRYLDYWRYIISTRLGLSKKLDMVNFIMLQYILPTAAIPDFVMTLTGHGLPVLSPLSGAMLTLGSWGMFRGLRRLRSEEKLSFSELLSLGGQTLRGMIYMMHWFVVIPAITARMSVRPKRLKWVKTVHEGSPEEVFSGNS